MATYICNRCGKVIEEEDLPSSSTWIPDQYGKYCQVYDTEFECECGGDYVEAEQCEICGEWVDATEVLYHHNGFCDKCFESKLNLDTAIKIGGEETEMVEINGFVNSILTNDEINEILLREIRQAHEQNSLDDDIRTYLEDSDRYEEIIRGEDDE